jgi:DNA polymerase (family 10)
MQYFTGSKEHNKKLEKYYKKNNIKINKHKLFKKTSNNEEKIFIESEKQLYNLLGMQFIPPELREDNGEIELAYKNELPVLVERNNIKGDLHIHSNWSDGVNTIEEILQASQNRKYNYIAITDHSRSLKIANGLSVEKLLKQQEIIRQLNNSQQLVRILGGSEVDILQNGSLDYSDDILKKLDIVIASVHSHMKQNYEQMTKRVLTAIENRYVDILAHPTGRILGRREPFKIDMYELLKKAAETNTALEINASPERLDLNDKYAAMAGELNIKIVINTDAHDVTRLSDMDYGIKVARRAGLQKENIINCFTYEKLIDWIKYRRNKG